MLTQICRDPGAPFYGACDRNWWHYKIRDFPSVIIQQAGYALHIASGLDTFQEQRSTFQKIASATATFWNQRALRHGAFEEYYPYEQGYPPVAFATLGMAKLCIEGVIPLSEIRPGLVIAASQLLTRFEAQAANQQIAGTAALSVIRSLDPSLIDEAAFQKILTDILELQHDEGWFPEYDGPDLGYLAVSIDCLWDIHDHTADPRILPAIRKAADCIAWFALSPFCGAGMHNSRNTDYFTPYGLVRLAIDENNAQAAAAVERLFTRPAPDAYHPFDAVDDRYWCHYIGHSVFRALALMEKQPTTFSEVEPTPIPSEKPGSGHVLTSSPAGAAALISTRKGAITTVRWLDGSFASDFGWLVQTEKQLFVTHWWNPDWKIDTSPDQASCEGYLVSHKEHISEPWKHILLRLASFFMGRRLIRILKKLVIFKKSKDSLHFTRTVRWDGETLIISDTVKGISPADKITRAPRTSKRHVASADSYHPEDLGMLRDTGRDEKISHSGNVFRCETKYQPLSGNK